MPEKLTAADGLYMAQALRLAARGLCTTSPNPRVGCVVVKEGTVVGQGWHRRAGSEHAEVLALRQAGAKARGATAYVSLEPCYHHGRTPPCCNALIEAGLRKVVIAMPDPDPRVSGRGIEMLRKAGLEVTTRLLEKQARQLNPGFIKRMNQGRPWLRCKLAMSVDGRTAMHSGASRWITGPEARADVHRLRAQSCAIITGTGSIMADNPRLSARPDGELAARQPLRVILDSRLRTSPGAAVFASPGQTVLLTTQDDDDQALQDQGAKVVTLPSNQGLVDAAAALDWLGGQQCNEALLESGPTLAGAMLREELIDEIYLYVAPKLLGSRARPLFDLPFIALNQQIPLQILELRTFGRDWRIRALPRYGQQGEAA